MARKRGHRLLVSFIALTLLAACVPSPLPPETPATGAPWITANPLDLAAITALSKFRSCSGHDYSGLNVDGGRESDRSMKHYVLTALPWTPAGTLRGYAPFDGVVASIEDEGFPLGQQVRIAASAAPGWLFVFFHADPLVRVGEAVSAGQPVVTWPPADLTHVPREQLRPAVSFDITLVNGEVHDSPLQHMAPAVLAEYLQRGFTPERLIVSQAERDAAPCLAYNQSEGQDYVQAKTQP